MVFLAGVKAARKRVIPSGRSGRTQYRTGNRATANSLSEHTVGCWREDVALNAKTIGSHGTNYLRKSRDLAVARFRGGVSRVPRHTYVNRRNVRERSRLASFVTTGSRWSGPFNREIISQSVPRPRLIRATVRPQPPNRATDNHENRGASSNKGARGRGWREAETHGDAYRPPSWCMCFNSAAKAVLYLLAFVTGYCGRLRHSALLPYQYVPPFPFAFFFTRKYIYTHACSLLPPPSHRESIKFFSTAVHSIPVFIPYPRPASPLLFTTQRVMKMFENSWQTVLAVDQSRSLVDSVFVFTFALLNATLVTQVTKLHVSTCKLFATTSPV